MTTTMRWACALLWVFAFYANAEESPLAGTRPNILLIMADDLGETRDLDEGRQVIVPLPRIPVNVYSTCSQDEENFP